MLALQEDFSFFELEKPPRLVRVAGAGTVEELTAKGWRRAPWLRRCTRRHERVPDREDRLQARCRQRLNGTSLREPAGSASWVSAWRRRMVEWVVPPLAYGAPVQFSREARNDAERAYNEVMPTEMGEELQEELVREAHEGYDRQETRALQRSSTARVRLRATRRRCWCRGDRRCATRR
jgi:hypothetical protein